MEYISKILIVTLTFGCVCGKALLTHYTWPNNLATILRHDTTTNQLLLLYENDLNNSGIYQIGNRISRILPTQVVNFKSISNDENHRLKKELSLSQKTIVLIISTKKRNENLTNIYSAMMSIAKISEPNSRPKVLFIGKSTSSRCQELLQYMWSRQFLDLTILEITETSSGGRIHEFAKIHHYNPFTRLFTKKIFSKGVILFPDKLKNLNGFRINAGIFHYPPYIFLERNSSGHVQSVRGTDYHWMIAMSNYLNFTLKLVISDNSDWDLVNCDKTKNVGITNQTIHKEIQFIGIQAAIYETCLNNYVSITKGTKMFRFIALAPILPTEVEVFTNKLQLINIINILSFFALPVLLAKYLNFDPENWRMMYTVQMVVGFSTPSMPRKTIERIMMLSLMFFYLFQSTFIFTTLSEMQLQMKSFRHMETFQDLLDANLPLVVNTNISEGSAIEENNVYQRMMMNAIISNDTLENIIKNLIVNRNISFSCREDMGLLNLQTRRNVDKESKVKILNEILGVWPSGIYLEEGSPFKNRFDRVMSTFMESGLSGKWDAMYISKSIPQPNHGDLFHQDSSLTSKVGKLMIVTLLIGFGFSLLVFVAEIFNHNYLTKFWRKL